MVKRNVFLAFCGVTALVLALAGCDKLPSSARPKNASSLLLSVPAPEGFSSQFTLVIDLKYRVASGSEVFSGSVSLSQLGSTAGPINIPLPHDGQWLVSAEWVNFVGNIPFYIGADVATVAGNTPFTLRMGT